MRGLERCQPYPHPSAAQIGVADRISDGSARMAAAYRLMPAGGTCTVPRLNTIPTEYRFTERVAAAARLALTLVSVDLVDPAHWVQCGRDPFRFIEHALRTEVAAHGGSELDREFFLRLGLVSDLDPYSCDGDEPDAGEMYLVLEPDSAGYVVLEPALRLLATVHPRLPVTFFDLFTAGLNRWIRVYDYRDALERVEQLREWYDADPDGEAVELPAVDAAIPVSLRKKKVPLKPASVERLSQTVRNRKARALLDAVLELSRTSQRGTRPCIGERAEARLADSNPPVPALVAVFNKHDAIEGCFDEECQGMLECTPEPNVILPFKPEHPDSVREAFRLLGIVCDVLQQAAALIRLVMDLTE
jgi:hypothetical protein